MERYRQRQAIGFHYSGKSLDYIGTGKIKAWKNSAMDF